MSLAKSLNSDSLSLKLESSFDDSFSHSQNLINSRVECSLVTLKLMPVDDIEKVTFLKFTSVGCSSVTENIANSVPSDKLVISCSLMVAFM